MDDRTVILHWDAQENRWYPIAQEQWISFRSTNQGWRALPNTRAGEQYFVVCIVDRARTLFNIIPHRYLLDQDGRILPHGLDDLSAAERERMGNLMVSTELSDVERNELLELQEKQWRGNLPPPEAAKILMRELPGFPIGDTHRPVWVFLRAFGMESSHLQN